MNTEHIAMQAGLGIAVIALMTSALSPVCRRLGQPLVVGQIMAGVAIGALPRTVTAAVFPAAVLPFLTVMAQVGLALFLFCVGYEIDLRAQRTLRRSIVAVAGGGFAVPMLLGGALALMIGNTRRWTGLPGIGRGSFILFMAVAMSITAVPVLACVLRERRLIATVPGGVAMSAAGLLDVICWLLLTVAIASAGTGGRPAGEVALLLLGFGLGMVLIVRPVLKRWMLSQGRVRAGRAAIVVPLVLAAAWCTQQMGLHPIFGALLAGVIMPRSPDGAADAELLHSVEKASSALLPVFFVVTGLSVRIGALDGRDWALFAVICALAVAGKLGGSAAAARMSRMPWRESVIVGALMNTRGLTELIAIDASRAAGLISGEMYTILVLMALVTTALTGPLLTLVRASALPRTTVGAYAAARALASPEAAAGRDSATIPAA